LKFSFPLPTCVEGLNHPPGTIKPAELIALARAAENLGFYALWANDHLAPWPGLQEAHSEPLNWYEILIASACCASVTTRIKLGLGVIVVPLRDPVLLAKQVATLDALSGGRVLLGVGIGTMREEFDALRPRDAKANRGRMLDEALAAMHLLFGQAPASFSGKYYAFDNVSLYPKPLQRPLPLYVSGQVDATLRRAARYGAGLMLSANRTQDIAARVDKLSAALRTAGRAGERLDITMCPVLCLDPVHERAVARFLDSSVGRRFAASGTSVNAERLASKHLIGTPEEVAERIRDWASAGMTHCAPLHIVAESAAEMIEQMHAYAEDLVPLCGCV